MVASVAASAFPPSAAGAAAGAGVVGVLDSVGAGDGAGGIRFGLGLRTGGIPPHPGWTATTPLPATSIPIRIRNLVPTSRAFGAREVGSSHVLSGDSFDQQVVDESRTPNVSGDRHERPV